MTTTSTVGTYSDPGLSLEYMDDTLRVPGGTAWQWFFNGTLLTGADTSWLVPQNSGAFHAAFTGPEECGWLTDTVQVVLGVGVHGPLPKQPIVHPVPATDRAQVAGIPPIRAARAWDMAGRPRNVQWTDRNVLLVSDWPPGVCVVEIETGDGQRYYLKVVKADL